MFGQEIEFIFLSYYLSNLSILATNNQNTILVSFIIFLYFIMCQPDVAQQMVVLFHIHSFSHSLKF